MSSYHKLPTVALSSVVEIERPEHEATLNMDSPAREIFTDFLQQQPLLLEKSTPVDEAVELMKRTHVKLKLVIDSAEEFQGVISLADLQSVKVMKAAQAEGIARSELSVGKVMTPREKLHAIDTSTLLSANIGDLLTTMKDYGDQHVLVVDANKGKIRGLVSASDIARALHVPVKIAERANSFTEIYQAVKG